MRSMKLTQAQRVAEYQIQEYLGDEWDFKFDDAAKRFGYCDYRKKTISISRELTRLNKDTYVRETILHEIAHALTGPTGHDVFWSNTAKKIGCSGSKSYDSKIVIQAKAKWLCVCDNCGHKSERTRKVEGLVCGRCCRDYNLGEYTEQYLLKWGKL